MFLLILLEHKHTYYVFNFTFHDVSINTPWCAAFVSWCFTLHSTMFLLILSAKRVKYDKKQILDKLIKHKDELSDFTFYQAEYSAEEQKIKIRKKKFWRLINYKGKVDGTEKV